MGESPSFLPAALCCRYRDDLPVLWSLKLMLLASLGVMHVPGFQVGRHFLRVGSDGGGHVQVPIFADIHGSVALDSPPIYPMLKVNVKSVPGAFILRNVLSRAECSAIVAMAEAMGFAA